MSHTARNGRSLHYVTDKRAPMLSICVCVVLRKSVACL